jgi:hypothetical protein
MKNTFRLAVFSFSYWRSFAKKEKKLKTKNSKKRSDFVGFQSPKVRGSKK